MNKDDVSGFENVEAAGDADGSSGMVPRARNRTVLLTPDITTQVRARISHDAETNYSSGNGSFTSTDSSSTPAGFSAARRVAGEPGVESRRAVNPSIPISQASGAQAVPGQAGGAAQSAGDERMVWSKMTRIVGFLVSFDKDPLGEFFVLRSGRMVVTSQEPPGGSFLFLKEESVSPMHAIVRLSESGEIQVLDQLSEYGTSVRHFGSDEEIKLSGDKSTLDHGDVISFGNRSFHICILANAQE